MQHDIFETVSRDLETFLYCHDINYIKCRKDEYGMTVWVYQKTPFLERVVAEFQEIVARRQNKRRS